MTVIGVLGLIVLLPLALAALLFDLARFAGAALVALVSAGFERLSSSG